MPYSVAVRTANCTLGSVNGTIDLGSGGNVYGYSKTGTSGTTSGGSVHGVGTTTNDPTRISSDFSATFPPIVVPVPDVSYNVITTVPAAFPVAGHLAASDSRYYYVFAGGTAISDSVAITGDVTFLMNSHSGVSAMSFSGNRALTINSGASLVLYTNGDIDTHGNALVNNNVQPASCLIYGTDTSVGGQSITVGGNGELSAAIYAPNASLTLQGGGNSGNLSGAFIGATVRMTGGTDFHYDEALGNVNTGNPFGISKWRELQSATERGLYADKLNF
ncbi:MAG: hypothetical protein PHQ04_00100 [Opitutaceae bacterium]|nr:hypothetical protein [Opitutaceae bacterium]